MPVSEWDYIYVHVYEVLCTKTFTTIFQLYVQQYVLSVFPFRELYLFKKGQIDYVLKKCTLKSDGCDEYWCFIYLYILNCSIFMCKVD